MCNCPLCAWEQASEHSVYQVPYLEHQERNIQPISLQEHRDAIAPMFPREIKNGGHVGGTKRKKKKSKKAVQK